MIFEPEKGRSMSTGIVAALSHRRRIGAAVGSASVVLLTLLLGACTSSGGSGTAGTVGAAGSTGSKLIILEMPFPCGLNQYASDLCNGADTAAKQLPAGFRLEVKTGTNYEDTQGFNNLIQTSLALKPAGLIVFPNGVAAQTPFLNQACAQGAKVIFVDSQANGVKCDVSFETVSAYREGQLDGQWLIAHPPSPNSKQVAVVEQQPGLFSSNDLRVSGFVQTVEAAGYKLVASVVSTNTVDQTRSLVTNLVTAHPGLAGIFSANPYLGDGTNLALAGKHSIVQLATGGLLVDMPAVQNGSVGANAADDPYDEGRVAVQYMADVLQGKHVPVSYLAPTKLIDKADVQQFITVGGMR
jgi:ribose transport system substrate-binding protein